MSHQQFDHFVLTRFNVRSSIDSQPASDAWLRARLDIFKQWSLPSVRRQSISPDVWLILCDAASPQWFREELVSLLQAGEEIEWFDGVFSSKLVAEAVARRCSSKPHLITTRLDNDDAIARDFVEAVQGCFNDQEREFVNFTFGAQYRDGRFFARLDPSNAFISLIERRIRALPITVYVDGHDKVHKHGSVRRVSTHCAWLQHVHGANIANVVRGVPVRPEWILKHFCLSIPAQRMGWLELVLDATIAAAPLAVRVFRSSYRIKWLLQSVWSKSAKRHKKAGLSANAD